MGKTAEEAGCPIAGLLEVLARPWTLQILWVLSTNGPTRFGELRRQVEGISSRVLSERLRVLAQHGFVFRDYEPTIPPSVTYGITKRMQDISKVLADLNELAGKWQQEDSRLRAKPANVKLARRRTNVDAAVAANPR